MKQPEHLRPWSGLFLAVAVAGCEPLHVQLEAPWASQTGAADQRAPLLTVELPSTTKVMNASVLKTAEVSASEEQQLLAFNHGGGVILFYGRVNPAATSLVVLVHGRLGTPRDFEKMGDRLSTIEGLQVCLFLYDDTGRRLERSAEDLATSLRALRAQRTDTRQLRLTLIGHSMGGLVAAAALQRLSLQSTDDTPPLFAQPGLIAIDTPWHGYLGPANLRQLLPVETSSADMVSDSAFFRSLAADRWPSQASLQLIEADQQLAGLPPDSVLGMHELRNDELDALGDYFLRRAWSRPPAARLRNVAAALERTLGERAAQRLKPDAPLSLSARRARLREFLDESIPRFAGSHGSVLRNPALLEWLTSNMKAAPPT